MRKLLKGVFLILTIAMLIFFMFNLEKTNMEIPHMGQQQIDAIKGHNATLRDIQHGKITEWIYAHSERISHDTAKVIAKESINTGKPLLIIALLEAESSFIPSSVSSKGAIGISQIMDVHVKDLIKAGIIKERRDLFNVPQSIAACNFILDGMLKKSGGNVSKALDSYLGGRDGGYKARILGNLGDLYISTLEAK
jgi:soluble lytic murein transglycosylase-like protein